MSMEPSRPGMATTISIPEELADELYERKSRGESYADVIWRLIEERETGETRPADEDGPDITAPDHASTPTPGATRAPEHEEPEPETFDDVLEAVAEAKLPGSGSKFEERAAAFRAVVEYLQAQGEATPSVFRSDVYPEHTARYTEGKDPARSWWKNAMYPALAELAERTDRLERADHTGEWRWLGDR